MAKENQNTEMARLLEQIAILIEQNAKMTKDFERMRAMMTEMLNALRASRPISISTAVFTPGQSPSVVIEDSSHPPGFSYPIGHNVVEAFAVRPEVPPQPQGLYVRPPVNIPAYTVPAAVAVYPSNNDLQVQARDPHYDHPQGNNFRPAESFDQGHHPESHTDVDRLGKIDEGELARKMESPEQTIRSIQSYGGSISFDELCLFSDMTLLEGFSVPKFELYNGQGDPKIHMRSYCNRMRGVKKQELLIACFGYSLSGAASEWWSHQDHTKWQTFEDLAQAFWNHFNYNVQIAPTVASLENIKKKPNESFSEFAFRWREQASRVQPPLADEKEMIRYFMKSVDEIYYQVLIAATGKSFNLAIDMGKMVEQGIKDGKIISLAALRATTQAIQSGSGFFKKDKKDEVAIVGSALRKNDKHDKQCNHSASYSQPPLALPQQHYYPLQNLQYLVPPQQDLRYSMPPPQHAVHSMQPFVQAPPYSQWRAPALHPMQNAQHAYHNQFQARTPTPYRPRGPPGYCPRADFRSTWVEKGKI